MAALTYREVQDLYRSSTSGRKNAPSMAEWARNRNDLSGTNRYDAGVNDSWIKAASTGLDRIIEATGAPEVLGDAFSSLGASIGLDPESSRQIGAKLPRGLVNFAPLLLAAPFTGGGSLLPAVLGTAATAGLSGADTYTETGSGTAGLISGATAAIVPKVAEVGGQAALRALGVNRTVAAIGDTIVKDGVSAPVTRAINERIARTLGQRVASYAGGQAAAMGAMETGSEIQGVATGEGLHNPFTAENAFAQVAGQIPFMLADIPRVVRATPHMEVIQRTVTTEAKTADAAKGLAAIPDRVPVTGEKDDSLVKSAKFMDTIARRRAIAEDTTLSEEERSAKMASLDVEQTKIAESTSKNLSDKADKMLFDDPVVSKKEAPKVVDPSPMEAEAAPLINKEPLPTAPVETEVAAPTPEPVAPDPVVLHTTATENSIKPVVDTESAVEKVSVANEVIQSVGESSLTNQDLQQKVETILQTGEDLTTSVERAVQSVATTAVDKAEIVQKISKRQQTKQDKDASAMAFMADREKSNDPAWQNEKMAIEHIMEKAAQSAKGDVDRFPMDVARVYQNWKQSPEGGDVRALYAAFNKALFQAQKPLPVETRSFKQHGKLDSDKGARRQYFTDEAEALQKKQELQDEHRASLPAKERDKDTSVFEVRRHLKSGYFIEQRIYPRGEALFTENTVLPGAAEPISLGEGLVAPTQGNVDALETTNNLHGAQELVSDTNASPQAKEVVRANFRDLSTALRNAPHEDIQDIIGFNADEVMTSTFKNRVAKLIEDVVTRQGFTDEDMEFMSSSEFTLAAQYARDMVHGEDAVASGSSGEQYSTSIPRLQGKPMGLLGGLSSMVDRWYKNLGYTDTTLQGLKESTLRVAALFPALDDARIGELINNTSAHQIGGISFESMRKKFPGAVHLAGPAHYSQLSKEGQIYYTKFVLGHELFHSQETQHTLGNLSPEHTQIMNRFVDHTESIDTQQRELLLREFYHELVPTALRDSVMLEQILSASDSGKETRASLGGLLATHLTNVKPAQVRGIMEFMPKPVGDFVKASLKWMGEVWRGIAGAQELGNYGLSEKVANSTFSNEILNDFVKGFNQLTRTIEQVDLVTQQFMQLQNIDPVGFRTMQKEYELNPLMTESLEVTDSHAMSVIGDAGYLMRIGRGKPDTEKVLGEQESSFKGLSGVWKNYVAPALQTAEAHPVIRPAIWLAIEFQRMGHEFTGKALRPFSGEWNARDKVIEVGDGSMQYLKRLQGNERAREAVNQVKLWENENPGKSFFNDDGSVAGDNSLLAGLSDQARSDVISAVFAINTSNLEVQSALLRSHKHDIVQHLASTVQSQNPSWKPTASKALADAMVQATEMLSDPTKLPQAQTLFQQLQAKLTPDQFLTYQAFAESTLGEYRKLEAKYLEHPNFTSERRFGAFQTSYMLNDGTRGRVSGKTAEEVATKLKAVNGVKQILRTLTPDTVRQTEGLRQDVISAAQDYEKVIRTQMEHILGEEEFSKIKDISFTEPLQRELAASNMGANGPSRRLASGRETLDMLENHMDYTSAVARSIGKRYIKQELALLLKDPELTTRDDLKRYAQQHINNFLTPDSNVGRALSSANFVYYMGMNISTTLMEGAQSAFSLVPTLVREGSGGVAAYKRVLGSAKSIANWALTKKWDTEEHARVMDIAGREHDIQLGSASEVLDPDEHGSVNIRRLAMKEQPLTKADIIKKPLGMFSQLSRSYYSMFTNFNHRVALLSAFDHFRAQGMDFDTAYENANRVNHLANFSGGRAARPVGLFDTSGALGRTASQALYSLQSYQLGMLSMMGRYLKEGFVGAPHLSSAETAQARKAAVLMLGTQLAAAGALGMPAVGASIAVLEQLFPDLELNKGLRLTLAKLGGDDHDLGAILSDMALHGVPNQIGGIDVGSRFALGNIMGTSSYNGFSVDNFIGPSGKLLANMAMGVQQASQGDLGRAVQSVLPQTFKRGLELYRNDGQVRDQRGNLLLQPTTGEKFAMMIGFSPTRVTALRDAQRMMQRSQQIERSDLTRFHGELAERLEQGDDAGVRQTLLDKSKTNSTYDPRAGARAIAEIVAKKTLPVDLRREGSKVSADDDAEILRTYSLTGPPPSETQRLQIQQQILNRLGLGARVTGRRLRTAQVTDQVMQDDPMAVRAAVRARVEKLVH